MVRIPLLSAEDLDGADAPPPALPAPRPPGSPRRGVHGRDDRQRIVDTSTVPWTQVCLLLIHNEQGRRVHGTGWIGGPHTVYTAGHNLRYDRVGHRAVAIAVIPGCNGDPDRHRQFEVAGWAMAPGWEATPQRASQDVGVVWTVEAIGTQLGQFGFEAFTDVQLAGAAFGLSGYPEGTQTQAFGTQWYGQGPLSTSDEFIRHRIDTTPGQSGSPLFAMADAGAVAAGVHVYEDGGVNLAARITPAIAAQMRAWWR